VCSSVGAELLPQAESPPRALPARSAALAQAPSYGARHFAPPPSFQNPVEPAVPTSYPAANLLSAVLGIIGAARVFLGGRNTGNPAGQFTTWFWIDGGCCVLAPSLCVGGMAGGGGAALSWRCPPDMQSCYVGHARCPALGATGSFVAMFFVPGTPPSALNCGTLGCGPWFSSQPDGTDNPNAMTFSNTIFVSDFTPGALPFGMPLSGHLGTPSSAALPEGLSCLK
jgi:hypothetical protein